MLNITKKLIVGTIDTIDKLVAVAVSAGWTIQGNMVNIRDGLCVQCVSKVTGHPLKN